MEVSDVIDVVLKSVLTAKAAKLNRPRPNGKKRNGQTRKYTSIEAQQERVFETRLLWTIIRNVSSKKRQTI